MTERMPRGMRPEDWVEHQIREADLSNLDGVRGAGKPIPGRGKADDELWWLRQYAAREKLDLLLPTGLRLRKEVEDLPTRLDRERQESQARAVAEDLDRRLRAAILVPPPGPAVVLFPLDVDGVLDAWRERRAARRAPVAPSPEPPPAAPVRRRWWRRRW